MKVVTQVCIILGLMVVGFLSKKANLIQKESKKDFANILLYIALPSATVSAFNRPVSNELLRNAVVLLIFGFVAHIFAIFLSKYLFAKEKTGPKEVMSYVAVFTNCAFMGFPVMQSLFGDEGVFYASIYLLSFNLFLWTYGKMLYTKKTDWKSLKMAIFNTGTLSVVVGALLLFSPIKLPEIAATMISMLGSMTTPLAMIVIGATLAESEFKSLFQGYQMYVVTFVRLLGIPIFWFFLLKTMKIDPMLISVCVLVVAMPAASNTAMFAEKYDGDTILASKTVVFTTIASMVTIPLLIFFMDKMLLV